jgi:hypothetical protein
MDDGGRWWDTNIRTQTSSCLILSLFLLVLLIFGSFYVDHTSQLQAFNTAIARRR